MGDGLNTQQSSEGENKFLRYLQSELDKIVAVQVKMNEQVSSSQILTITQRRDFFLHITSLTIGFSGLTFFTSKVRHEIYFIAGLVLLLLVLVLVVTWFREVLDKEGNDLQKLKDRLNGAAEEKKDLVNKFAIKKYFKGIELEYFQELRLLPGASDLKNMQIESENAKKGSSIPDYFGECLVFLFLIGLCFSILSVLSMHINVVIVLFLLLLIFSLSFQDFVLKTMLHVSGAVHSLHRQLW